MRLYILLGILALSAVAVLILHQESRNNQSLKGLTAPIEKHTRGHWVVDKTRVKPTVDPEREAEALTLPYLQGYKPAPILRNVTIYKKEAAYGGVNFCVSGHESGAFLMDMQGRVLHHWNFEITKIWPDAANWIYSGCWRRALLNPEDGSVLVIFEGVGILKLDRNSNLLWSYRGGCHHQAFVTENGLIYVLTHKAMRLPQFDSKKSVLSDYVTILDSSGHWKAETSLLKCLENSDYRFLLNQLSSSSSPDLFHTNSIYVIEHTRKELPPEFSKGRVLISILNLSTIALLDLSSEKVAWAATGDKLGWKRQHDVYPLEQGTLMLFDNLGRAGKSRVLEFSPGDFRVKWEYPGNSNQELFSDQIGMTHRLPNGNTLIVESEGGRAIEVTRNGEIVWEYYSPYRAGEQEELIATLFQMDRIPVEQLPWLKPTQP